MVGLWHLLGLPLPSFARSPRPSQQAQPNKGNKKSQLVARTSAPPGLPLALVMFDCCRLPGPAPAAFMDSGWVQILPWEWGRDGTRIPQARQFGQPRLVSPQGTSLSASRQGTTATEFKGRRSERCPPAICSTFLSGKHPSIPPTSHLHCPQELLLPPAGQDLV